MGPISTFRYYASKFGAYQISTYAASASFFLFSALFPLLMLILAVISYTPFGTQEFLDMLAKIIPEYFQSLFYEITGDIVDNGGALTLSISLVATLWTASKSMLGLVNGLNAVAEVTDRRNFIWKRIVCIGYMLLLMLVLVLNLGLRVFGQMILSQLQRFFTPLTAIFSTALNFQGLMLFGIMVFIFALIYTVFPNKKMRFLLQIPGALFTSFAWFAFSELFSLYVDNFTELSTIYGSLGLVVLVMLWMYFCMAIIFIGAVINRIYPSVFWRMLVILKHRHRLRKKMRLEKKRLKGGRYARKNNETTPKT